MELEHESCCKYFTMWVVTHSNDGLKDGHSLFPYLAHYYTHLHTDHVIALRRIVQEVRWEKTKKCEAIIQRAHTRHTNRVKLLGNNINEKREKEKVNS